MFTSFESFTIFFLICFSISLIGFIFEDKFVAAEKRIRAKNATKKSVKRRSEVSKVTHNPNAIKNNSNAGRNKGRYMAA